MKNPVLSGNYKDTYYILEEDKPFSGHCYNTMRGNGMVDYQTPKIHFDEYNKGKKLYYVDSDDIVKMLQDWHETIKTLFIETTEEEYDRLLNCLPPQKWHNITQRFNVFFMLEAYTADLHTCCLFDRKNQKYYVATRSIFESDSSLLKIIEQSNIL